MGFLLSLFLDIYFFLLVSLLFLQSFQFFNKSGQRNRYYRNSTKNNSQNLAYIQLNLTQIRLEVQNLINKPLSLQCFKALTLCRLRIVRITNLKLGCSILIYSECIATLCHHMKGCSLQQIQKLAMFSKLYYLKKQHIFYRIILNINSYQTPSINNNMGKAASFCCEVLAIKQQRYRASQKIVAPINFQENRNQDKYSKNRQQMQEKQQAATFSSVNKKNTQEDVSILPVNSVLKSQQANSKPLIDSKQKMPSLQMLAQNSFEEISVPFQVVKLIINLQILKCLLKLQSSLSKTLMDRSSPNYRSWKLQKEGHYTNKLVDGRTVILNSEFCYLGQTSSKNQFIPQGQGILIKTNSFFQGNFRDGRAHGEGRYQDFAQKVFIQAKKWENGSLKQGRFVGNGYLNTSKKPGKQHEKKQTIKANVSQISTNRQQYFQYQGSFDKNIPHGYGELRVFVPGFNTQVEYTYKGIFNQGRYEDPQGIYESVNYIYRGSFKQGKKDGIGEIQKAALDGQLKGTKIKALFQKDRMLKQIQQN